MKLDKFIKTLKVLENQHLKPFYLFYNILKSAIIIFIMNVYDNKNISDEELFKRCLLGDQCAWQILYDRFHRLISYAVKKIVTKYAINLTKEDIEECEQFVWISLLKNDCNKLRKWEQRCSLATWIKVCSCSATIDFLESYNRHISKLSSIEDRSLLNLAEKKRQKVNPERETINKELYKRIKDVIEAKLSSDEKLFTSLFWDDGYSFGEISKIMKISPDNLYVLKHRIIKKIRNSLDRSY